MRPGPTIATLAPAHLAGLAAFQAAFILAFIDVRLAAAPLLLFLAACIIAPFLPCLGFFLPIICRGGKDLGAVALTFDDGPDPATTPALLELLAQYGARATFFVTGLNASAHPDLIRLILSRGHTIGNHSYSHSPLLMLKSGATLRREISSAQALLRGFGITPLAFRPPVGITNPRLWRALLETGMCCVNFSCRAFDAGNRRVKGLSEKILKKARSGDIILLHDVNPGNGFDAGAWIREIEAIIAGLKKKELGIAPLTDVIGRPVMLRTASRSDAIPNPAEAFYNGIARTYDAERNGAVAGLAARKEDELFESHLLILIAPGHRVLEIGAGTGRFTIPLARRCGEITAVELSENMAAVMKVHAARENLCNIEYRTGDIESIGLSGRYDVVCSFSSFEYIPDLDGLFRNISRCMNPGGIFYFTTAHRSLFRLFTQIGNAMRQGIWLHARTTGGIGKSLASAGFTAKTVSTHVMKTCVSGGMLLEVLAVKDSGRR
jgi:peptidoglycan/xylan/chitin deacetylase (PgdA/CDA1 family)/2-polyprenyl-3-methyl-5-hydroxy-6-metoxy-1,4-benzoquinol methylase